MELSKINFKNKINEYAIYIVLILLFIFFSIATPAFLNANNLINVIRQISMLGIASVGMTFALLVGGIDLSIGSQMSMVAVICSIMMTRGNINPWIASLLCIILTSLVGFFNGLIISKIKMPPLIVTLSSMIIIEGVAFIISKGIPIFGFPYGFSVLGQGYLGFIPIPVIIMTIILIIGSIILNKTYIGRFFYAIGGNEEASRLSGIQVDKIKCLAYTLSGLFAGIAGVLLLSRTNSGQPTMGKGFEFDVLTAVVLGGVSVNGGIGKISNVVSGILIIGVLNNGLVLMGMNTYVQAVVKGVVLLIAVAFDFIQRKKDSK